jgi:hypothetical protein
LRRNGSEREFTLARLAVVYLTLILILISAYHDMATYDKTTGLGGLDGSILFEQERAENVGDGIRFTLTFLQAFTSQYVSSK